MAHKLNDNFDFRPNIILEAIRNVLRNDTMKSPQSLFVLNLGLHYAININFTTYQKLIDDVIVLLLDREVELGSRAQVVWKTTTATYGHKAGRTSTKRRFYTEQVGNMHVLFELNYGLSNYIFCRFSALVLTLILIGIRD